MAELKELNIKRGRIKKSLTNFEKHVSAIDESEELTSRARIKLQMKLDLILPKYDEFVEIHNKICEVQEAEDDVELDTFENLYFHVVSMAKDLLADAKKEVETEKSNDADAASQSINSECFENNDINVGSDARVQLPSIKLPSFSGNPESWLDFRDMFQALIHEDVRLNNTKKLYYLRGALEGDAKLVLQGLKTTAENYETAWSCLCERYENRRLLVQNHLNAIYCIKNIKIECPKLLRELLDKVNSHLRALANLNQPIAHWDTLIVFLLCKKLDPVSMREWENLQNKGTIKSLDEFKDFLRNRADMLESLNFKPSDSRMHGSDKQLKHKFDRAFAVANCSTAPQCKCYYCHEEHAIYYCPKFKALSVEERIKRVAELKLCANCLRPGHGAMDCIKSGCIKCRFKVKHNSLLHLGNRVGNNIVTNPENENTINASCQATHESTMAPTRVLLPTAVVGVTAASGKIQDCRVFLDQGSQVNLISTQSVKRLGLCVRKGAAPIGGVGTCVTQVLGTCHVSIHSKTSNFTLNLECSVLPKISNNIPQFNININKIKIPENMLLADPNFTCPGTIDILIGAGDYCDIFKGEIIKLGPNLPALMNTEFGWIVTGKVPTSMQLAGIDQCCQAFEIQDTLMKFWEIEDIPQERHLSAQEEIAENHFIKTTYRNETGRFVVSLPFKEDVSSLGQSEEGAKQRFLSLERRLQRNSELKMRYEKFIQEYIDLGHMTLLPKRCRDTLYYFLPHHCVVNESSLTTKTRVVFDGSFATTSGLSRNQIECVGPVIQSDLLSILLRFRCYPIAISADIAKMYRQVLVAEADQHLQCILWRGDPAHPLSIYKLNTVTYGTASASFLATRCLLEVSKAFEVSDPSLSTVIKEDFYVDDILTGVNSVSEGEILCAKLSKALSDFCFPLQKWNSNNPAVLKSIETKNGPENVILSQGESTKTLGLYWEPKKDNFHYSILRNISAELTKRSILSSISQIFDPLGLVGACVILPKILLQGLWELKLDWDDPIPSNITDKWLSFRNELHVLNTIKIPRCIISEITAKLQIHGFADASERAYGACIYLRCENEKGIHTSIICAKSKVAPLKMLTIPRLELCAALVLSKLLSKVLTSFRIKVDNIYLWSDSEIVLCWLKKPPSALKLFVANRVSKVQALTRNYVWSHVISQDNPADLISRGLMPTQLALSELWWHGPKWLSQDTSAWPSPSHTFNLSNLPELKITPASSFLCSVLECPIDISRFSQYRRLLNACAYMLRFINHALKRNDRPKSEVILPHELTVARDFLLKFVQESTFSKEIYDIRVKGQVKPSSALSTLVPFIDSNGIMRVSGRLQNSNLSNEAKHPIILPHSHNFTKLLFQFEHRQLGHAGPQQLLSSIRQTFWPLQGKSLARKTLHECVTCFRVKPKNTLPRMAPLPAQRVTPSPPFLTTGVDYAGPLLIKERMGRGVKSLKCYVALFVCFSTKAIHVEVVSNLSTPAFIAAFRRFSSRRGKPATVWSDNGTNFVGANNELERIIKNISADSSVAEALAVDNIKWKFIPSNSPHFGGLWESGVRSVKFHLKRIVGNQILTFEELSTLCCQIEAIVNSRPLTSLSDDPSDPSPLTPSHFLIGRSLTSLPDEPLGDIPQNRLARFQLIQQMVQAFWGRWSTEYLHSLQATSKWKQDTTPLTVGQLVLIRCDQSPPMNWPLGRISELFPGTDGIVRVASVIVKNHPIRRAIHKLYPLPIENQH